MILRVTDTETCGLEEPSLDVVEIATVDLLLDAAGAFVSRGDMWSTLVNPGKPIPPEASAVHHITDDMVKGAPSIGDVRELLASKPPADYHVAHNSRFEAKVLPWLAVTWLDTYRGSVLVWPDAPSHKNQVLRYWLKLRFADDPGPPHRALGDAYCTAALARRLLTVQGVTIAGWIDASSMPVLLPRFHFGEHAGKPLAEVPVSYLDWIVNKSKGTWDEDVMFTAKTKLAEQRRAQRSRSPV